MVGEEGSQWTGMVGHRRTQVIWTTGVLQIDCTLSEEVVHKNIKAVTKLRFPALTQNLKPLL